MIKSIKKHKLILAYDGTNYCGWQAQNNLASIESVLKKSFLKTFGTPLSIVAASRTDAQVHALGQVVLCKTSLDLPPKKLCFVWNNGLPSDITIRSVEEAHDTFHPWYQVQQKTYYYHFFLKRPIPFLARYGLHYHYNVDFERLQKALAYFVGTHNFRSFTCAEDMRNDTVRTVDSINLLHIKKFGAYRIEVRGKKFLRHMIRRIIGASLYASSHSSFDLNTISHIIKKENPHHILPNAPAHGLMLRSIQYNKE